MYKNCLLNNDYIKNGFEFIIIILKEINNKCKNVEEINTCIKLIKSDYIYFKNIEEGGIKNSYSIHEQHLYDIHEQIDNLIVLLIKYKNKKKNIILIDFFRSNLSDIVLNINKLDVCMKSIQVFYEKKIKTK